MVEQSTQVSSQLFLEILLPIIQAQSQQQSAMNNLPFRIVLQSQVLRMLEHITQSLSILSFPLFKNEKETDYLFMYHPGNRIYSAGPGSGTPINTSGISGNN
jgi:hypothetical protein